MGIEELGEEVFNPNSTVVHGTHKPSSDAVSRMVVDLDKQIKKRAKFSRRRTHNDDDDIDYNNQRNARGSMANILRKSNRISKDEPPSSYLFTVCFTISLVIDAYLSTSRFSVLQSCHS